MPTDNAINELPTYHVVSTGQVLPHFDKSEVVIAIATLFKVDLAKAQLILQPTRVIKKDLDRKKAKSYQVAIEKTGLITTLTPANRVAKAQSEDVDNAVASPPAERVQLPLQNSGMALALEPMETNASEQCSGLNENGDVSNHARDTGRSQEETLPEGHVSVRYAGGDIRQGSGPLIFVLPIVAAIVGAFLWQLVAVVLDLELGLVAWGIGGAVGAAAAISGARGDMSGLACAALAFVAIIGGKYLAIQAIQDQYLEELNNLDQSFMMAMYEGEKVLAAEYLSYAHDEVSTKEFMFDNGYAEVDSPGEISFEELQFFLNETVEIFSALDSGSMDFVAWQAIQKGYLASSEVTFGIIFSNLDWLDFLFLILGVSTAFRLGRGEG